MPVRRVAQAALGLALQASLLGAASYRLSQGEPFGDLNSAKISPDGRWAVHVLDAETDQAYELWSVPVAGGAPARLCGILPANEAVSLYEISPDSSRVVYTAHEDDLSTFEIYSSPITGAPAGGVKLNGALIPGTNVEALEIAPDSSRVVFTVSYGTHRRELWSATLDGSDLDNLLALPAGRLIGDWKITPDSTAVIYVSEAATEDTYELWRVPITDGMPFKLSLGIPAGNAVTEFDISPDSLTVAYVANRDSFDKFELFAVPAVGGASDQLSDEHFGGFVVSDPRFAPDSGRVVYVLEDSANQVRELWSVEPDGDGSVRLNGALTPGGTLYYDNAYRISPDSQRVIYYADQQQAGRMELYTVPIAGGGAAKLNGPLADDGDVSFHFEIAPGGQYAVYMADEEENNRVDVYAAPITGGPGVRLNQVSVLSATEVQDFLISSDGTRVFYTIFTVPLAGAITYRLWSAPIAGGDLARVDGCAADGHDVFSLFAVSPTAPQEVLYRADQDVDDEIALYVGDDCVFCNGFEGPWRWSIPLP